MRARAPLRIDLAGGWSDIPPFARKEGGAVVSIAVSPRAHAVMVSDGGGVEVQYRLDLPSGTGLGSSASLTVAWLALLRWATHHDVSPAAIAEGACTVAGAVGVVGGKQDEYAAAFGGVNLFRFGDDVSVEPIDVRGLVERLVVCNSGVSRLSGEIHDAVWGAYQRGDSRVARVLADLRDCALDLARALRRRDSSRLAECMNRNWALQQELHPSVTNPVLDRIIDAGRDAGALAAKACGAGGGGCVVLLVPPGGRESVARHVRRAGGTVIDVMPDNEGVTIED
ncbi:MAG: GHMP kinase [Actinobacteria bacterium]|nr:GHMP kinase [Actinomycetota bacterium]